MKANQLFLSVQGKSLRASFRDVTVHLTGPELDLVDAFAALDLLVPDGTVLTVLESSTLHFPEEESKEWDRNVLEEFTDVLFHRA